MRILRRAHHAARPAGGASAWGAGIGWRADNADTAAAGGMGRSLRPGLNTCTMQVRSLTMSISPQLGQEHRVDIPQGTISYRERGNGCRIVFVHGVGVNGDLWRHVAPRLASSHR